VFNVHLKQVHNQSLKRIWKTLIL